MLTLLLFPVVLMQETVQINYIPLSVETFIPVSKSKLVSRPKIRIKRATLEEVKKIVRENWKLDKSNKEFLFNYRFHCQDGLNSISICRSGLALVGKEQGRITDGTYAKLREFLDAKVSLPGGKW